MQIVFTPALGGAPVADVPLGGAAAEPGGSTESGIVIPSQLPGRRGGIVIREGS